MDIAKRVIGALLIASGCAVGIWLVIEPLIYTSTEANPYHPVWDFVLDPSVAIGVALGVAFSFIRKRRFDAGGAGGGAGRVSYDRIAANVAFYGFVIVGILFYWDWLAGLNAESLSLAGDVIFAVMWVIIYALWAPLAASLGVAMLRGDFDAGRV